MRSARTGSGFVTAALILGLAATAAWAEEDEPAVVENGKTVSIEYTLTLDDGTRADSNVGKEPLVFEQGANRMLPAFEEQLVGMKVDESKQFTLTAEQGYGAVRPERFREVPLDRIPEDARKPDARLVTQDGAGNRRLVRVQEVREEVAVLDFNHPLAGQKLNFDVKVLEIR